MPGWSPKSWLKSGTVETRQTYEALDQDELPTAHDGTRVTYATERKEPSKRRGWYRIMAAVLIVAVGFYLIQTQRPRPETAPTANIPNQQIADTSGTNPALPAGNLAPTEHDVSLNKPASDQSEGQAELPQLDSPSPAQEGTDGRPQEIPTGSEDAAAEASAAAAAEPTSDDIPAPPLQTTTAAAPASTESAQDKATEDAPAPKPESKHDQGIMVNGRKLHLLVPATEAQPHMCRTLFTAVTMGYPTPALINWGQKPRPGEDTVSHLEKVAGITNYLKALGPDAKDDLALITDAYDVWFNLPPSVIVSRYERVIAEEDAYTRALWGDEAVESGMKATTVFAADKGCFGFSYTDHWCYLHPDSTQPTDLYGDKTGVEYAGFYRYSTFRPRFLNSGIVMGPVSELLAIFERAEDYMKSLNINPEHDFWQSDQRVLIMVLASQQLMRTRKALGNPQWLKGGVSSAPNRTTPYGQPGLSPDPTMHADFDKLKYQDITFQDGEENVGYEHGMVIDYNSTLSQTTNGADHEWAYFKYSTPADQRPKLTDPRDCRMHLRDSIPDEIGSLPVPYSSVVRPSSEADSAQALSWSDLPLYTNLCSGEIPAIIHHNGDKSQRDKQWPSLWYSAAAFDILKAARAKAAAQPDAGVNTGGAVTDHGDAMSWDDICKPHEEKIFVEDYKKWLPGSTQFKVPESFWNR